MVEIGGCLTAAGCGPAGVTQPRPQLGQGISDMLWSRASACCGDGMVTVVRQNWEGVSGMHGGSVFVCTMCA